MVEHHIYIWTVTIVIADNSVVLVVFLEVIRRGIEILQRLTLLAFGSITECEGGISDVVASICHCYRHRGHGGVDDARLAVLRNDDANLVGVSVNGVFIVVLCCCFRPFVGFESITVLRVHAFRFEDICLSPVYRRVYQIDI